MMKYCKTCQVQYDTDIHTCVFCNAELETIENDVSTFKFPEIKKRSSSHFFMRLYFFLNILAAIVSIIIDYVNGTPLSWSLVVSVTTVYAMLMYITFSVPTIWTSKMVKTLIVTVLAIILIGLAIRDYHWAVDYVLPFALISNIFLITTLIVFNKRKWYDHFASLVITAILGLAPGLLNLLQLTTVEWPSLVCFSYAVVTILGIIFLPSKSSREEFKRRFHI